MAKQKTSIGLDPDLVARLDQLAAAKGKTRSDLITQFIERGLGDAETNMVEVMRLVAPPSQMLKFLQSFEWHDKDGPLEFLVRSPSAKWSEWLERSKGITQ